MEVKHFKLLHDDLSMSQEEYQRQYKIYAGIRDKVQQDPWRLHYHIMPESGWLNDPNGLCQFHGIYHIYYQYSPFDVEGKTKLWGHMTSKDLVHFQQEEPVLFPDSRVDERGVYSGSALIKDDQIHYFYTGNVKYLDQEYDYIVKGREQNTVHVTSKDGFHFSNKEWVFTNEDYPMDMSCHVRDPKIYQEDDHYYMVFGARDLNNQGCVLLYESNDLQHWSYHMRIQTDFGYMWECPDLCCIDGSMVLITCPQGVKQQGTRFMNVHQCGYFPLSINFKQKTYTLGEFHELDYGFDFYAPQTFEDEKGRRILIGWMGLPDIPYTNPTIANGWQHALTIPRELHWKDGILYQTPIKELQMLRKKAYRCDTMHIQESWHCDCFEMRIDVEQVEEFVLQLRKGACLSYSVKDQTMVLSFDACGFGRGKRSASIETLHNIVIYADTSSLEIFINDGASVFTSRVYAKQEDHEVRFLHCDMKASVELYELEI